MAAPDSIHFFKSAQEFRKWLSQNHSKVPSLWVGFYKQKLGPSTLTQGQAIEQAICFGWIYSVIKGIDPYSYKMQFVQRKPKSAWSPSIIKKFKELQKKGLVTKAGLKIFEARNKKKSEQAPREFSVAQLRLFKKNKVAWSFFTSQTPSYQKYTTYWVVSAKKPETQAHRLGELIRDSGNGSKLKRIVDATNKVKNRFEPGKTPIEEAKNIGLVCGTELRSIGIKTVEQLKEVGWEEAFQKLCELYPARLNQNMLMSLVGAVENQSWRKLDVQLKNQAKRFLAEMMSEYRD